MSSAEPLHVTEARAAIVKLLGELRPPQTAEWISERTDAILRQFHDAPDSSDAPD
jgi:hypothetical protein